MNGPQIAWLADGKRLHLNHGPIDLIIETFGARDRASRRLTAQALPASRRSSTNWSPSWPSCGKPVGATPRRFAGPTANRMERAVQKFHPRVHHADGGGRRLGRRRNHGGDAASAADLDKAYVNNGGDIAHPPCARQPRCARRSPAPAMALPTAWSIRAADPVRGIATSGWRGRSFSLGIADAVTVLAQGRRRRPMPPRR